MNFLQKVSIISTEIFSESEYRFCQISRRKIMHFLSTLSQKLGIFAKDLCAKISTFCEIFSPPPSPAPTNNREPCNPTHHPPPPIAPPLGVGVDVSVDVDGVRVWVWIWGLSDKCVGGV